MQSRVGRYNAVKRHVGYFREAKMACSRKEFILIFLDGDIPRRPSYRVCISQLIWIARVCSHVTDFNARNKCLTANFYDRAIDIINYERPSQNFNF